MPVTPKGRCIDRPGRKATGAKENWPVAFQRPIIRWFPAGNRLIGLIRANVDSFVLPPAIVRKANWRE